MDAHANEAAGAVAGIMEAYGTAAGTCGGGDPETVHDGNSRRLVVPGQCGRGMLSGGAASNPPVILTITGFLRRIPRVRGQHPLWTRRSNGNAHGGTRRTINGSGL